MLISAGEMYTGYLHGIAAVEADEEVRGGEGGVVNWGMVGEEWRGRFDGAGDRWRRRETRVSLTFRDVVRVRSLGKGLGFLAAGGKK